MIRRVVVVLFLLTAVSAAAHARREPIPIAVSYGVFLPSDSTTETVFGDSWPRLSIGVFDPQMAPEWRRTADFTAYMHEEDGEAKLYSLSFGAERRLSTKGLTQPYVALRAGPYYGKVEVPALSIDESKIGLNANASLGVIYKERVFLEARYDKFSRIAGFDFDGFTFWGGVRLFDIRL